MDTALSRKAAKIGENWKALTKAAEKGEFDYPLYKATFEETYGLLRPVSTEFILDKQLMPMLIQAHSFVCSRILDNKEHRAAVVIAERMLQLCAIKPTASVEPVDGTLIYALETQEEVYLNFADVDTAMEVLGASIERSRKAENGEEE